MYENLYSVTTLAAKHIGYYNKATHVFPLRYSKKGKYETS